MRVGLVTVVRGEPTLPVAATVRSRVLELYSQMLEPSTQASIGKPAGTAPREVFMPHKPGAGPADADMGTTTDVSTASEAVGTSSRHDLSRPGNHMASPPPARVGSVWCSLSAPRWPTARRHGQAAAGPRPPM